MNNDDLQIILGTLLGDGHLKLRKNSAILMTSCIHKEYLEWKQAKLSKCSVITKHENNGYKKGIIYKMNIPISNDILHIVTQPLDKQLDLLDNLGIAVWFYDDGSLHNKKYFYNLNTQAFSKNLNTELFIPFFNKLGIYPKLAKDKKYFYLRINKLSGADKINKILSTHFVKCYDYKSSKPLDFVKVYAGVYINDIYYVSLRAAANEYKIDPKTIKKKDGQVYKNLHIRLEKSSETSA